MEKLNPAIVRACQEGLTSKCPFCLAVESAWPPVGTNIIFLRGDDAGCRGVVENNPRNGLAENAFVVKMDYELDSDTQRVATRGGDLFLDAQAFIVPDWMLPLSIDDNAQVHERLFSGISKMRAVEDRHSIGKLLIELIDVRWQCRLPIDGADIFPMLRAHGIPSRHKASITAQFNFGTELLTSSQGRAPIKKKRMPAMSKGRYLTRAHQEFLMRSRKSGRS